MNTIWGKDKALVYLGALENALNGFLVNHRFNEPLCILIRDILLRYLTRQHNYLANKKAVILPLGWSGFPLLKRMRLDSAAYLGKIVRTIKPDLCCPKRMKCYTKDDWEKEWCSARAPTLVLEVKPELQEDDRTLWLWWQVSKSHWLKRVNQRALEEGEWRVELGDGDEFWVNPNDFVDCYGLRCKGGDGGQELVVGLSRMTSGGRLENLDDRWRRVLKPKLLVKLKSILSSKKVTHFLNSTIVRSLIITGLVVSVVAIIIIGSTKPADSTEPRKRYTYLLSESERKHYSPEWKQKILARYQQGDTVEFLETVFYTPTPVLLQWEIIPKEK
ncbi:MAG: hypothetical protein QMD50_00635 [Patescibacteria group bacterium]|nr:hypothetical protein [Patescibacteria group bacterium]